ncbi:MAG: outer membrane protein assembly factor BamA [Dokdonella sp.]|uniref:outer membrane protein assembly factor BamA n=1 Tax=Dokdonella sp. TaxID=2291710 RepID=UPI0025BD3295|nr:outer membrane protein assembly factor BamA [Dokdonella sp.]MBX3699511.1 outer membrane protein assembly factor BamA [Dokdonella sp.]
MKRVAALFLLAFLAAKSACAFDTFTISDIRIDGLSRIAPGTVFTYLPVEKGDTLTPERAEQATRALYKTGFFNDIALARQGDILVITVKERPQISKIAIRGNKDIKEEDLLKGLKGIGLAEGEAFDPLKLSEVRNELTHQYYNRGKYNVSVKTSTVNLDRNRVEIAINIAEGKAAKIKHLNIVGNTTYSDKQIEGDFESSTSNWTSWYSKDDQYSREKLSGDLEKLQSYYMDRGYADFDVESTQVSISPDKRKMYVVASIKEGEVYKISDIKLTGTLVLREEDLRKLIQVKDGEVFSRKKVEQSVDAITAALSNIGYAFADVNPLPAIDKETREVSLNFFINPGKRVYVRRIVFKGNLRTEDEVLRREMRQLEGSWYSQAAIDRSRIRLQRLGFFSKVEIDTPKVPGSDDQVDVTVNVEEQNSGQFTFGLGYSQVQGLIISAGVTQNNFFGTGDRVSVNAQRSAYLQRYSLSYYEPYLTDDGIGLGYDIQHSKFDAGQSNLAAYLSSTDSFDIYLGFPITEADTINTQIGVNKTLITGSTYLGTPQPMIDYLDNLGHRTFHTWNIQLSWAHDTRNRYWNPTRGSLQSVSLNVTLPGSTLQYYKATYQFAQYLRMTDSLTFYGHFAVGYGDTYKDPKSVLANPDTIGHERYMANLGGLPFFENFYAGGVSDVRGFRDNTLGPYYAWAPDICPPSDKNCRWSLGGSFKTTASAEIIFPTPFVKESNDSTRLSAFVDVGNVFKNNLCTATYCSEYRSWSADQLRASVGISFQWRAPVGPIVINIAKPIRKKPGDDTETIQFMFGNTF